MSPKISEKITDALAELMEAFAELQQSVSKSIKDGDDDDDTEENDEDKVMSAEQDEALVAEVRTALESALESEDVSPEEFATLLSSLTEALEEIDPDVFREEATQDVNDETDAEDVDDEDIDLDEEEDLDDEDEDEEDDD
jgi:ribonuclease E